MKFIEGGPTLPATIKTSELKSWTELGGDNVKAFSGTGSYAIAFNKPAKTATDWQLDLGRVHEEAEVYLNGVKLATLIGPQYIVNIPSSLLKVGNQLEIRVANLMANRIIDMDKKKNLTGYSIIPISNRMAATPKDRTAYSMLLNGNPKPSGLIGPVTLRPQLNVVTPN